MSYSESDPVTILATRLTVAFQKQRINSTSRHRVDTDRIVMEIAKQVADDLGKFYVLAPKPPPPSSYDRASVPDTDDDSLPF